MQLRRKGGSVPDQLACLDAAVTADPTYAEAHYQRANLLHSLHRVDDAFEAYSAAIEVDPNHLPSHTNFPTLLYKYDIGSISLGETEALFQRLRRRAQDLVVQQLSDRKVWSTDGGDGNEGGEEQTSSSKQYRLVRNVSNEAEAGADEGVSIAYLFDAVRGQVYGSREGPARANGAELRAQLPLNPLDADEFNHMTYSEKTTVMIKYTEASLQGQNGVVVRGDSEHSARIFVPSPQSMVPLHSLLDMPSEPVGRLEKALSVVQMSCDNYYHWTMECLPRLVVSLEYLRNSTTETENMTVWLPTERKDFITEVNFGGLVCA